MHYPFKRTPRKHQLDCWLRQKDELNFALYPEMGCGKTKILIDTVAYLYDTGKINALVVVAPKGVYRNWSDAEIPADMPGHIRYKVGIWDANPRKAEQEALDLLFKPGDEDLHILLMNVEALATDRACKLLERFLLSHHAMLAVDESTVIKNPAAIRTKKLIKIGRRAKYRRVMSGEPFPNSPLDAYSQFDFLGDGLLGYDSFYTFKAHFARLIPIRLPGRKMFQKIDGYRNEDELQRLVSKHAFVVKKADCLDLPAKVFPAPRWVEMGPLQQRAYNAMRDSCMVDVAAKLDEQANLPFAGMSYEDIMASVAVSEKGDNLPTSTLMTASLVITQMLRLQQILCGFAVTDDKVVVPFDESNPRVEELMQVLEEVSGKVIIWATYKFNVAQIAGAIAKKYGPESVVTFYGPTSMDDRRAAVKRFQNPLDPCKYFVSNDTGARGITLTQGKTVIYYSCGYNADTHNQSQDRAHRIGQTDSVTYIFLAVRDTQDVKVREALLDKKNLSDLITPSNWRTWL